MFEQRGVMTELASEPGGSQLVVRVQLGPLLLLLYGLLLVTTVLLVSLDMSTLSLSSLNSRLPLRFSSSICCIDCLNFDPIFPNFAELLIWSASCSEFLMDDESWDNMESGVLEGGYTDYSRLERFWGALLGLFWSPGLSNDPFEVTDPSSDNIELIEVIDSRDISLPDQDPLTLWPAPVSPLARGTPTVLTGDKAPMTRDSLAMLFS